jgi:hypothetical protein
LNQGLPVCYGPLKFMTALMSFRKLVENHLIISIFILISIPIQLVEILKAHSANLGNDLFGKEWNQCLKPYFNELSQQGRLGNIKTIETTLILQTIVRHFIVHSYCSRQGFTVEASASNCLRESEIVDQAFTYVEEHLEEPLKIQVLAKNIGASCKTLNGYPKLVVERHD